MKQKYKSTELTGVYAAHDAWNEVVRQVLAQGCVLGTRMDEPTDDIV
jgi:hypothetical protein